MGLRPAKTIRESQGQPWSRISRKKPRKSYVKGAPKPKVRQYNMGTDKFYDIEVFMNTERPIQIRDNAIEAARQICVKYLEKNIPGNYYVGILKYPHLIIREHSALGVAGADRISKGMKKAFGRPKGRLARIKGGDGLFVARVAKKDLNLVKEAFRRAMLKLSGRFKLVTNDITKVQKNIDKIGKEVTLEVKITEMKKEEKKVEGAEAAAVPGEEKKEGEKAATGKDEKEEKKTEKKK